MKKIISLFSLFLLSHFFKAQITPILAYQTRVNQVSAANINNGLQEFVNLGVKTTGSTANNNAFSWLKTKYTSFGYTTSQMSEDTFTYSGNPSKNLIVTKTGTLYPNTYVIICGHYDSIVGVGANDNGSGTTAILEIARILKDIPTEYSIKFIHFSGEEQGLLGSQHYVSNVVNSTNPKMDILLVFNLDQIGGRNGQTNNTVYCERDTNNNPSTNNATSTSRTQELMDYVEAYSTLTPILSSAYASDYMPFQSNNEIITGFYEHNGSSNPYEHTANDVISNMDPAYLVSVTKAALGALQHFAVASTQNLALNEVKKSNFLFEIVPNPAKDFIEIKFENQNNKKFTFELLDASGRLVKSVENESKINISNFENGMYTGTLILDHVKNSKKILIQK